jgi:hypothetical protein
MYAVSAEKKEHTNSKMFFFWNIALFGMWN